MQNTSKTSAAAAPNDAQPEAAKQPSGLYQANHREKKMNEQAIAHMFPHFEPEMDVYDKRRLWTNMVISEWDCTNLLRLLYRYETVLKLNSHSENPASQVQVWYQEGSFLHETR